MTRTGCSSGEYLSTSFIMNANICKNNVLSTLKALNLKFVQTQVIRCKNLKPETIRINKESKAFSFQQSVQKKEPLEIKREALLK